MPTCWACDGWSADLEVQAVTLLGLEQLVTDFGLIL